MRTIALVWVGLLLLTPAWTLAAVIINEVAWMGTQTSANDEWIELHNTGSGSVNLSDWILSDGQNLTIELVGSLPAGQYAVLERTDDASAPGSAFLIYVGALGNDGRTLTLRRPDGSIADQVAGGDDWENIGGDNTTKETAQFTTAGWHTANATPGSQNASYEADVDDEAADVPEDDTSVSSSGTIATPSRTSETIRLVEPDTVLDLSIDAQSIAYVNQVVEFVSETAGVADVIINSLKYQWNFGDLTTSKQKTPTHRFQFPGEYVVTLEANYARHRQVARHTITVLPTTFTLQVTNDGDLQILNNARYEVDLSGYVIQGTDTHLTFPENSIIVPNGSITIPRERLFSHDQTVATLFDPMKEVLAVTTVRQPDRPATPPPQAAHVANQPTVDSVVSVPTAEPTNPDFQFVADTPVAAVTVAAGEAAVVEEVVPSTTRSQTAAAISTGVIPKDQYPYLGLIGLLLIGILAVVAGRTSA